MREHTMIADDRDGYYEPDEQGWPSLKGERLRDAPRTAVSPIQRQSSTESPGVQSGQEASLAEMVVGVKGHCMRNWGSSHLTPPSLGAS